VIDQAAADADARRDRRLGESFLKKMLK